MTITSNFTHPIILDLNSQVIKNNALKNNSFFFKFISKQASQSNYSILGSNEQKKIRNTSYNILRKHNFYFLKQDRNGLLEEVNNCHEITSIIDRQLNISCSYSQFLQNTSINEIGANSVGIKNPYKQHIFLEKLQLQRLQHNRDVSMKLQNEKIHSKQDVQRKQNYKLLKGKLSDNLESILATNQLKDPEATFNLAKKFTDSLEIALGEDDAKTALYLGSVAGILLNLTRKNLIKNITRNQTTGIDNKLLKNSSGFSR